MRQRQTMVPLCGMGASFQIRRARADDLRAIVELLASDPLGQQRESIGDAAMNEQYERAFRAIDVDPNQHLIVLVHTPSSGAEAESECHDTALAEAAQDLPRKKAKSDEAATGTALTGASAEDMLTADGSAREEVVGTLQLTFLRYLTHRGGLRAQIEAVRIKDSYRGRGLGKKLVTWAITQAEEHGARMIQLTTDKQRTGTAAFYESLGFTATHHGMKRKLHA